MRRQIWPSLIPLLVLGMSGCSGEPGKEGGAAGNGSLGVVPFGSGMGTATPKNASLPSGSGGPGIPVSSGPPPQIDHDRPADLVSKGSFAKGNSKLEVLGVCKIGETDIQCWWPDGTANPELAGKLVKGLQTKAVTGQTPTIPTRFRHKNRVVIVRNQGGTRGLDPTVVNWHVGSQPAQGLQRIGIPGVTDAPLHVLTGTQAQIVIEPANAKETSVRFVFQEPIRGSAELECQVGESVTLEGMKFTVKSIKKMTSSAWFIQIEADIKSMKGLSITFTPLDKDGRTFEWVNAEGMPISEKERLAIQNTDRGSQVQFANPKTSRVRNTFEVLTLVDPTYIRSLSVRGFRTMQGTIEGIRLDPK